MPIDNIIKIIRIVLAASEDIMKRLRKEKRQTGDFSKTVSIHQDDLDLVFNVGNSDVSISPFSDRFFLRVEVIQNDILVVRCDVFSRRGKFALLGDTSNSEKYRAVVTVCNQAEVPRMFQSGDTIIIQKPDRWKKGNLAFAKAEIISEETSDDSIHRKLRLTPELGHQETLACETDYPPRLMTFVADDSTLEYFDGKDSMEKVISLYLQKEKREAEGLCWYEYTSEETKYNSKVQLAVPVTEKEMLLQLRQHALKELLDDCRGEFCYGDKRVRKYMEHYIILGEETVIRIHDDYLAWLKDNCTIFPQEANSGEFTGIAIDWHGKEDRQPDFSKYAKA